MDAAITKLLSQEDPEDAFHCGLLAHAKQLVAMSKSARKQNYDSWDLQESVFRGEIVPDKDDTKKLSQGRPQKVIMPTSYAQTMTFVSFHFLQFTQDDVFFNLKPTGDEDYGTKKADLEQVLEFDLRKNEWHTRLFQSLLDIGRFGESVLEVSWTKEKVQAWVEREQPAITTNGITTEAGVSAQWEEFVKFEGNRIRNVSPFRFFPDTRHALVDFQKGEFCAIEEEYSMNQLYQLEADGETSGVKWIQPIMAASGNSSLADIMSGMRGPLGQQEDLVSKFSADNGSSIALVTKVQMWIIPCKFKLKDYIPGENKPVGIAAPVKNADGEWVLGKETHKVLYHLWYANANRVVRLEQAKVWHNEFSFCVGQFTPDLHQATSFGLGELIYPIQELQSWYMNSHVRSVDRVIANRLIISPTMVDTKTLDGNGDIYIRKGISTPLDRAVGQLRIQDVTSGHMNDAGMLGDIIEQVTGVNKMMQGQSSSGRRSSFQDRTVAGGAASRQKLHGSLFWETCFGRLGRLMLSNLRQTLSQDSFVRVIGSPSKKELASFEQAMMQYEQMMQQMMAAAQAGQLDPAMMQQMPQAPVDPMQPRLERYAVFKGTPEEVISGDDYLVYDNSMPQDKQAMSQSLQELLMVAMQNPDVAMRLDISAKALLEEMMRLRNAGPVSRFSLSKRIAEGVEAAPQPSPEEIAAAQAQAQPPAGPAGPQSTDARDHSVTTTHAPVVHIHEAKPAAAK